MINGGSMMQKQISILPIPLEIAVRLCDEIRKENSVDWHSVAARWCWMCENEASGDVSRMGFSRLPDNRGCSQINARFIQLYASG
jgi:hypothetical protein